MAAVLASPLDVPLRPTGADFLQVRSRTLALVAPLSAEDAAVQSMPDASPAKWHLAHTSWFFEQFVLGSSADYQPWRPGWERLFNSYYETVGPRHPRPARGLLTRPSLAEVIAYRDAVDERVLHALAHGRLDEEALQRLELGLHHEQQHQELLLTDIKHLLAQNPLRPAYRNDIAVHAVPSPARPLRFIDAAGGRVAIGHAGDGFGFDCEGPRHEVLLQPYALADRPISNADYAEFVREGGYRTVSLWLSEGWAAVQREGWCGPLYWSDDGQCEFTLAGERAIDPQAPVCHISYFEADAFARWAGARLPTEAEWEAFAASRPDPTRLLQSAHWADHGELHPRPAPAGDDVAQLFGDVWEWTASPYAPYPRFRTALGALGEYNGKFMCGQYVLRGGSCASPAGHLRASYRNFFYPRDRWQFMGLRLAQDR